MTQQYHFYLNYQHVYMTKLVSHYSHCRYSIMEYHQMVLLPSYKFWLAECIGTYIL